MDDEIKAMFAMLLEGQNNVETKFVKLQEGQNRVESEFVKLLDGQNRVETEFVKLLDGQNRVEIELKKNSIKLESIETKIDIIAEVQTSHKEQNEIAFKNSDSLTEEKVDLLGTSIKSISKDVKEVKESIDVMKDVLGRNQIDIEILKRRPV